MAKPAKKKVKADSAPTDCTCSDPLLNHFVKYHLGSVTKLGRVLEAVLYTDCQLNKKKCPKGTALIIIRPCPRPPCPK